MIKKLLFVVTLLFATSAKADDAATITKVEKYLNTITTISATFSQNADGNISGGKFYLKRPGKFRWVYDERQPIEIISDGKQLIYYDKNLKEVTYASLQNSLAGFLARKDIKLSGDVKVLKVEEKDNVIGIKLTQKDKSEEGKLTMFFKGPDLQITMLLIEDINGGLTRITFDNVKYGEKLDDKTFVFKDPKFHKNAWDKD